MPELNKVDSDQFSIATRQRSVRIPAWAWIAYVVLVAVGFLLFQQPDLYHTSASSYAYLNGHIADFYDYNRPRVERNDYLPVLYVIFAIWNLPLKFVGLMSTIDPDAPLGSAYLVLTVAEVVWTKLLLVAASACAVFLTARIARLISARGSSSEDAVTLPPILLATSPIGIFAVLIFGQYDVLGVCFALAGIYCLLQDKKWLGAVLFSVAVSFKFFALVIFVPIVLLFEKNLLRIIALWFVGGAVTLCQIAIYWGSQAFREGIFVLVRGKGAPLADAPSIFLTPMFYLLVLYAAMCVWVYLYRPASWMEKARAAIFIPIVAYGLMFSAVVWHPQWLVISTPFFALSVLFLKNRKLLLLADALGAAALIWISVNFWRFNVDSSMLTLGPLKAWFPFVYTGVFSFLPEVLTRYWKWIFHVYLFFPVVVLALERLASIRRTDAFPGVGAIGARALVVFVMFVVPSLATALIPRSWAVRLDPQAATVGMRRGKEFAPPSKPAGEIYEVHDVRQHFVAPRANLKVIGVRLATYARANTSMFRMRLLDDAGAVVAEKKVPAAKVGDSVFHYFEVPVQPDSAGRRYTLVLDSEDGKSGNALTVWMGTPNEPGLAEKLELGGKAVPEALSMRLFFSNDATSG